ncbi:MAG: B12-binding domain-containing radical SAM protein [Candidatus Aminicenantes bacterium]|nr:B12-binding domain-containing radical SAM protein [Candidatus Aminicenantes bacterium]
MADVVLIKLESDRDDQPLAPPYGILYVASALEKAGLSVKLFHERGTPEAVRRIGRETLEEKPLFAGFSCLTGPSLAASLDASRLIKRNADTAVVWGGVHPTLLPEQVLAEDGVDVAVLGEGEATVVDLAGVLKNSGPNAAALSAVEGIAFKDANGIKRTAPRPLIPDLDAYSPAWHLLDRGRYIYGERYFYSEGGSKLPGGRVAGLITSRGCPWRCGYCLHESMHRRTFRAHSVGRVLGEIKLLKEAGVTAVNFEDANFFTDKERALEIVRAADISWGSSMRADVLARGGERLASEISARGCVELQVGAESGSQRVLDLIHKDITPAQIRESARLGRKFGIRILFSFMAGVPGETWDDILATLDLMDEIRSYGEMIVTNGPFLYFPFPGTSLYGRAVAGGFRPPAGTKDWTFLLWGIHQPLAPYVPRHARFLEHYRRMAWSGGGGRPAFAAARRVLGSLARARWRKRCFRFPLDYHLPRFLLRAAGRLGVRGCGRPRPER